MALPICAVHEMASLTEPLSYLCVVRYRALADMDDHVLQYVNDSEWAQRLEKCDFKELKTTIMAAKWKDITRGNIMWIF